MKDVLSESGFDQFKRGSPILPSLSFRLIRPGDVITLRRTPFVSLGTPNQALYQAFVFADEANTVAPVPIEETLVSVWQPLRPSLHRKHAAIYWREAITGQGMYYNPHVYLRLGGGAHVVRLFTQEFDHKWFDAKFYVVGAVKRFPWIVV